MGNGPNGTGRKEEGAAIFRCNSLFRCQWICVHSLINQIYCTPLIYFIRYNTLNDNMQDDSCLYESYSLIVKIEQVNNCKIIIFDESNEEKEHCCETQM